MVAILPGCARAPALSKLKVVHLSTHELQGGAALAANRLHQGLLRRGVDSTLFVRHRATPSPSVLSYRPSSRPLSRLRRWWRRGWLCRQLRPYRSSRPEGFELFSLNRTEFGADFVEQIPAADVIHLHWTSRFIDLKALTHPRLRQLPLVLTLHDMNGVTGGCHYTAGCTRFTRQCGRCPQLGSTREMDLSLWQMRLKARALERRPNHSVRVVTASAWMAEVAGCSSLLGRFPVSTIPYGLDTQVFAPRDRLVARAILDLPASEQVILFAANHISNPRKGLPYLLNAVRGLPPAGRRLLSFGHGAAPDAPAGWAYQHLGPITDERFLSLVYSAADVFVIPSVEEGFGQTILEAMACGVPGIGFRVGGIPDIIVSEQTGYLVPKADVLALRAALERVLGDEPERRRLAHNSRRLAETTFPLEKQADAYLALYQEMLPSNLGFLPPQLVSS